MKFVASPEDARRRLILLAPAKAEVPDSFLQVEDDPDRHEKLLCQTQTLRGALYLQDGAITPSDLAADGRHRQAVDDTSWHLLAVRGGTVCGAARYREIPNKIEFSRLGIAASALAQCDVWGVKLRAAIEADLRLARAKDVPYVEFGGWVLAEELRCSMEGLRIALAVYSLAQALGGCIGVSNATRRHRSSSILRRIGGRPLSVDGVELPAYYDPQYSCEMEMLRFDSVTPNPRYEVWIDEIRDHLLSVPIIRNKRRQARRERTIDPILIAGGECSTLSQ